MTGAAAAIVGDKPVKVMHYDDRSDLKKLQEIEKKTNDQYQLLKLPFVCEVIQE